MQINAQVLDEEILQNMIILYQTPGQTRIAKAWNAIRWAQSLLSRTQERGFLLVANLTRRLREQGAHLVCFEVLCGSRGTWSLVRCLMRCCAWRDSTSGPDRSLQGLLPP